MKQINFNTMTKETTVIELPDVQTIEVPQPAEPTLEERVTKVEQDRDEIITVLAEITGVSV